MKRSKPAAEPIPRKFQPGARVKPTAEAINLGWKKHGEVVWCGNLAVRVQIDGDPPEIFTGQPIEWWEPENA